MKKNSQDDITKILKPYTEEVKQHINGLVKKSDEDIKRHMSALSEDFQGRVKVIAELVLSHGEKIDSLTETVGEMKEDITSLKTDVTSLKTDVSSLKTDVTSLKTDVASIKTTVNRHTLQFEKITKDVGIIKDSLKKKVDYDEFIPLEKRVSRIELKQAS